MIINFKLHLLKEQPFQHNFAVGSFCVESTFFFCEFLKNLRFLSPGITWCYLETQHVLPRDTMEKVYFITEKKVFLKIKRI